MSRSKREFWAEHVDQWSQSGLSKAKYCYQNGLNVKAFYNWSSHLKRKAGSSIANKQAAFTQVNVPTPAPSSLRVRFGGIDIFWDTQSDPKPLMQLLRQLGAEL